MVTGRILTEYEKEQAMIYGLCRCGSPRVNRMSVNGTPRDPDFTVTMSLVCLWNGHED